MPPETIRSAGSAPPPEVVRKFKVSLFGESSVGKTSILHLFDKGFFKSDLITTIGMDCSKLVMAVDGVGIGLTIWDTAGQERFRTLTEQHYRGASGLILTYDVSCRKTFERLSGWMQSIEQHGLSPHHEVIFIVGNKTDLPKSQWTVDSSEAQEFADSHSCRLFLASAKSGKGINQIFYEMAVCLKDAYGPHELGHGGYPDGPVGKHYDRDNSFHLEDEHDRSTRRHTCCAPT